MADIPAARPTQSDRFAFLGREFLTWLWFEHERGGGLVNCGDLGDLHIEFGKRLTLESGGNVREGSTVSADAPAEAEESRTALRVGKKVAKASLVIGIGDRRFEVAIDAESYTFGNVKLPTVLGGEDAQRIEERLHLLEELENAVDSLYLRFVHLRKDAGAWAPVREAMRTWVSDGASA